VLVEKSVRMRIAINTRFLLPHKMEGFGWYTYEMVKRLVLNHPEHTFLFFFDRNYDERFLFAKNIEPIVLNPPARHPLLFIWWFEIAVKRALKKHKADLFFSPDGYLSLGSSVKQIPVMHDLNFEHYPQDIPWSARMYYKYFFPKFAKKAHKIVTVSDYSKQDICSTYKISQEKVHAIWNGASEKFAPISAEEKLTIQQELTGGKPYFLFVGSLHPRKNVKRLLEAYQAYRKQYANFDLVVVGEPMWKQNASFLEYADNTIHFTGHLTLERLTKVMGAASIFVFVPYFEGFGIPLVEAMRCGTPIIAGNKTSLPEILGDAGILVDPFSVEEITQAMITLSTDVSLQQSLSAKGLERSQQFSWDKSAEKLWEVMITTLR
jgi:glycosyltransferase involved in cell wall biosynthesis